LSGGCFQNRLLLTKATDALREAGFDVLTHGQVPCNDGGVSLGQAVIANSRLASGDSPTQISTAMPAPSQE
jgi:hydrogenase maturation protein HypF